MRRRRIPALAALAVAAATTVALLPGAAALAATPTAPSTTAGSHVIVLLKNQHSTLPADPSSASARVKATTQDQVPLVKDINAHAGHAGRSLHVVNALSATVTPAE